MCMNTRESKIYYTAELVNARAYKEGWMLDVTEAGQFKVIKTDYYHDWDNADAPTFVNDIAAQSFVIHKSGAETGEVDGFYTRVLRAVNGDTNDLAWATGRIEKSDCDEPVAA